MSSAIRWFANNPVASNLLMIVMVVAGLFSLPIIQQQMFPELETHMIVVSVPYLGASPSEVEEGVCIRIEEELNGLSGIEKMTSSSAEGACAVTVELLSDQPVDRALSEIKNAVDSISTFPDETEKPIVSHLDMQHNVLQVVLSGPAEERTLRYWGEKLRDGILALPGFTHVDLTNIRQFEVSVEVSESSLRRYGLTFEEVANAVRRSSLDLPGGAIKTEGGEILLRAKGQAYTGDDFNEIVVLTREDGTRLMLSDVAKVVDGFEENDRFASFNGAPSVMVRVFRVGDQKLLDLARRGRAYLETFQTQLPEGLELTVWRDDSTYLRDRLNVLINNGVTGFVLVFIVLTAFLRLRLALWVAIGVPVSLMGALALFPVMGLSLDVLTLFAFILVLGLLVDDAIVVGENIHTHQERAEDPLLSAISGTQEVSVPVIFGVLTTVAAFLPMLMGPGGMGRMFGFIGIVVVICLFCSLVESQLILPSHLGHHAGATGKSEEFAPRSALQKRWKQGQQFLASSLTRLARGYYRRLLETALAWRYVTVTLAVGLLVITLAAAYFGNMKWTFFPDVESDYVSAVISMPPGTPVEQTALAVGQIRESAERVAAQLSEQLGGEGLVVQHIMDVAGGRAGLDRGGPPTTISAANSSHQGEVSIELVSGDARQVPPHEFVSLWRAATPPVVGAEEVSFIYDYFSFGAAIDIQLSSANVENLERAADRIKLKLAEYKGVYDITDSFQGGKAEIQLDILPAAESLGLTLSDLARQVRQAFYGEEAQRIQRGRDDIRVMVRYPEDRRTSLSDLENLRIRTPAGDEVPFYAVARASMDRGYSTIKRIDRQRTINVTADVSEQEGGNASQIIASLSRELPDILEGLPDVSYTYEGERAEQSETFDALIRYGTMALILIYSLLAIPLRSYTQPVLIMSVIPFGLVGAIGGHLLMGLDWSFMSVFGVVALSGVVVNSSLVLVHAVNRLRDEGTEMNEALRKAGVIRFRPIVLTAITTFVGLTPLMLEQNLGAAFLVPMGVSLAFGVVFATVISLLIVPSGYLIMEDLKNLFSGKTSQDDGSGPQRAGMASGKEGAMRPVHSGAE
ncbi:MAG: efflux RND transporter permease subunit [Myxococcota bacterium]|nr:efflux RND transporter permease subunit [Myxococcota bacterium]